jgi:hypothetical protein
MSNNNRAEEVVGAAKRQRSQRAADWEMDNFVGNSTLVRYTLAALSEVQVGISQSPASSSSSPASAAAMEIAQGFFLQSSPLAVESSSPVVCDAATADSISGQPSEQPAAAVEDSDVTLLTSTSCETFTCVGGTWLGGNAFEPCVGLGFRV